MNVREYALGATLFVLQVAIGIMAALVAGYVVVQSVQTFPPFIALLAGGAAATVVHRLVEMVRTDSNPGFAVLSAVAHMSAILTGVFLVAWVLWIAFSDAQNPIDRFQTAAGEEERIWSGVLLAVYAGLAVLAVSQTASLWGIVRSDAFGPPRD